MPKRFIANISACSFFFCFAFAIYGETAESIIQRKMFLIKEIRQSAASLDNKDIPVCVVGYLTRHAGGKKHLLSDSTGTISVEIYPFASDTLSISDTIKLLVSGEVDNDVLEGIEIKVRDLQKYNP